MGSIAVPNGLRALGVEVVTLSERYGTQEGQWVADVTWMPEAAAAGEAVLMADDAIRKKNPEEARVLVECGLRAFVINAQLPATETVRRFEANLAAIQRACQNEGPFVYRLHPRRIERRRLRS